MNPGFLEKRSRRGFSLVVSLVMMALMLMIAITLVSFVYVQARLTESKLKRSQAQINAISGMRVALGQLQLLTGDDQRVTATADLFGASENNSLPSGGEAYNGKRFWTGVWATGGLDKTKIRDWSVYSPDKKPFLGWLVSDYDESKEVYSPNESPVNRNSASQSNSALLKVAQSEFRVDDEKIDVVTLVGKGTLGTGKDAADELSFNEREVKVRRVPLMKYSAASNEEIRPITGSFAYWVGDEGVKARVNIPDATDEKFIKNPDWTRRYNVVAQRNGVSLVEGLESFDSWWEKDADSANTASATRLGYVSNAGTLPVYAEALGSGNATEIRENARKLFHDVSFVSQGIFTDTYNGGLKTDLSLAFEMPWFSEGSWTKGFRDIKQFHGSGEKNDLNLLSRFKVPSDEKWWTTQPDDGLGYLYEIATGESSRNGVVSGDAVAYLRGPTWDLVRNYYRLYKREDENKGLRGHKPANKDSWLVVGSRPYTYLSGNEKEVINSSDGSGGGLGEKYNFSSIVCRHYTKTWSRWNALLTEFNGETHARPRGGSTDSKFDSNYQLIVPQSMRIAPVVRRILIRCSIIFNQTTAAICFDPIITIHNPYNVPIEFFGFGALWTKFFPFDFSLVRDDGYNWPGTTSPVKTFQGETIFGQYAWSWRIFARYFAGTDDFNKNPSGSIRMLPGEVIVMFPASATQSSDLKSIANTVGSLSSREYEEKSAAARALSGIDPTAFTQTSSGTGEGGETTSPMFHVEVTPIPDTRGNYNDLDALAFHLYYPESSNGKNIANSVGLKRSWGSIGSTVLNDVMDNSDYDLTQVVAFRRYFPRDGGTIVSRTFQQTPESGISNANKQFFAYIDVQNLAASDSSFAGKFQGMSSPNVANARPWVVTPASWDGNLFDRNVGIGWKKELKGDDSDTNPVDTYGSGNNTRGYWGDSFGSSGQTNVVLFEIPTAPLLSLGQLQHVECSVLDMEPSYVIANSYSNIGFTDAELDQVLVWPDEGYMKDGSDRYGTSFSPQPRGDTPFAANLNLFDRYFFSGINFGDTDSSQCDDIEAFIEEVFSTDGNTSPFPNKRISVIRDFGSRKEAEVKKDFYNPETVARNLTLSGAFNINSTSVEAWKAVLSGLRNTMQRLDGTFKKVSKIPVLRFSSIIGNALGGFGSAPGGDEGNGWRWYCELDESDIEKLAEEIVKQVRERGPFMSLSDFVNRRLTTEGEAGSAGALQLAIDKSGINKSKSGSMNDDGVKNTDSARYPNLSPTNMKLGKAGVPGYLSQGDLLANIGSGLSARSDTFTIRAYGDISGVTGTPEARAWCEAVVQRVPEFFDPQYEEENDEDVLDSVKFRENYREHQDDSVSGRGKKYVLEKWERDDRLSAVNKLFGRRYKIISFRWLSQDEI